MPEKGRLEKLKKQKDEIIGRVSGETRIELNSNYEAYVEGCKGILEYDDSLIRVSAKRYEIRFTGENLNLRCLNSETIIIDGKISGVEFI